MRGEDKKQSAMFSYVSLERRIPMDHPLRSIRSMADRALEQMSSTFDRVYAAIGRPSIAPERLIRGLLLQVLYSVRSERPLIEQLDYNLLFRWFVGLEMDDEVWDVTVFTKNRERLIDAQASQQLLAGWLEQARGNGLLSEEHLTVGGTLIQAWASARSFKEKNDPPPPGEGSGHGGEVLLRDKVESETDPEARLFKKATADKSVPCYQGHAVIENRNGLVVGAEASQSATNAEREVSLNLLNQVVVPAQQRKADQQVTVGADTQYQDGTFIEAQRQIAPHVSEYEKGNNRGKNSLHEAERADPRKPISQQKRTMIERVFGWAKLDRPLRQVKVRRLKRVDWFFRLDLAAYNLVRMRRLIPFTA